MTKHLIAVGKVENGRLLMEVDPGFAPDWQALYLDLLSATVDYVMAVDRALDQHPAEYRRIFPHVNGDALKDGNDASK